MKRSFVLKTIAIALLLVAAAMVQIKHTQRLYANDYNTSTNIPKWVSTFMRTNNFNVTITNVVRLSPEECVRLGGHCYVDSPVILSSNPPRKQSTCKHCKHATTIELPQ